MMTFHAGHRVTDIVCFSHPCGDVHKGISGYHGFIHSVKCQQPAARRPEGAFADAELVAVHRLPVHDAFVGIVGYSNLSCACGYIKVISDGIGDRSGFGGGIGIFGQGIHGINYL